MKHLLLVITITFFVFIPFLNNIECGNINTNSKYAFVQDSTKYNIKKESSEDVFKKEKITKQNNQLNKISDTLNTLNNKFDIILKKLNENKKNK
jgi:hypothetical protein